MDNHRDEFECRASSCARWRDYAKGCVYVDVILNDKACCIHYTDKNVMENMIQAELAAIGGKGVALSPEKFADLFMETLSRVQKGGD